MKREETRGRKGFVTAFALVLLLAGAVFLFAPLVKGAVSQGSMNTEIEKVQNLYSSSADEARLVDEDGDINHARAWLERYNQRVEQGEVAIAADPFSFEEALGAFGAQGLEDGLIGYIEIPTMNCMLPLYLGSSEAHMTKGATVVLGSSAPLGEVPSNCVIAAHRGYGDAPMFRDIEKLSVGDEVSVCTVWESYSYTVTSTKVIAPSDSAAVGVQPGKDLVTLITCHPYGSNAYRYVVECERSDIVTGTVDGAEVYQSNTESHEKGISLPEVEDYVRILGGVVLVLCALVLVVRAVKNRRNRCAGAKHRRK